MSKWLFIRPKFEEVTEITFEEAQDAIDYLEGKGETIIDLAVQDAVRENVEAALRENPDANVAHYDHGSEDSWVGNDERAVVDLNNVDLLVGRECYCDNCSSAKTLGVEAWKGKAKAYWGYKDIFYFTTDAKEEFQEFVNNGIKRRVDGYDWKECLEMTKELATELIDKLVKAGKALAAACMTNDRDILVCYTEDMPPTSDCTFRRLSIRLFGPKIGWKLGKKHIIVISVAAVVSILAYALGFNTLDWMVFTLNPPETWCFIPPNTLRMPFWWAYFLGGIVPLSIGSFLAGLIVGMVTCLKLLKRKTV